MGLLKTRNIMFVGQNTDLKPVNVAAIKKLKPGQNRRSD